MKEQILHERIRIFNILSARIYNIEFLSELHTLIFNPPLIINEEKNKKTNNRKDH